MMPSARRKERLDLILVERGMAETRTRAQALILAGRVHSGTLRLQKPGERHPPDLALEVEAGRRFVSRGSYKLRAALAAFELPVDGRDCIDVGSSTGGFTQVLLQAGAARVIALDVGRGQLEWGLRLDERVVVLEGINARRLREVSLPFCPSVAVIDVSFISLTLVLPPVVEALDRDARRDVVALVKPQFEVGRGRVGRGGIVRDPSLHREVLVDAVAFAERMDWCVAGVAASPITGAEGNREFFLHARPDRTYGDSPALERDIESAIAAPVDSEGRSGSAE
jgi:23S rRNA (cytidine1920-2'-O)/16S rRNA (cytidine1409-2'-O)-methyltransferase